MKTILCYGDSNTWGAIPDSDDRYPYDVRWTGVLQKELGAEYMVIEEGCSGRTTVWDAPVEDNNGDKNGKRYLPPCLYSHHPLDLVIIILGTNDLKPRFSVTAFDIAAGAGQLVEIVQKSACGPKGGAPKILLAAPPPVKEIGRLGNIFAGSRSKSLQMAKFFQDAAEELGVEFMDLAPVVQVSEVDGIHYPPSEHAKLGKAIAERVKRLI